MSEYLLHPMQTEIILFLKDLREKIITAFEDFEQGVQFEREPWSYHERGGGEIALIRGNHFEKGAVNWSGVGGSELPLSDQKVPFFATGVSLITHMWNPHVPTVHFNIRFIETPHKCWFGGGYDLSPMGIFYQEDTEHFHSVAHQALLPFGKEIYPQFAKNAKEYFYIPHRGKERGVGGIFFDHYSTGNFQNDYDLWRAVGNSFLDTILPIYNRRINTPFSSAQKEEQLIWRGHYAEFNLMYDRGTQFGFRSKGNPKAILCSMPPHVMWK